MATSPTKQRARASVRTQPQPQPQPQPHPVGDPIPVYMCEAMSLLEEAIESTAYEINALVSRLKPMLVPGSEICVYPCKDDSPDDNIPTRLAARADALRQQRAALAELLGRLAM